MWRFLRRAATLVAATALTAAAACAAPPPEANPARDLAVEVFSGTQYTEPLQANVTWRVGVPAWNGQEWAGLTEWPTAFNAVITIHPDYLNRDVVAHEGGHVVCWWRYGRTDEPCATQIMEELTGTP